MTNSQFCDLLDNAPLNNNIQKTLMVIRNKLAEYRRIAVSYSGGSDSDIMIDLIELTKPDTCGEVVYVFFDTGLEWDATLRHVAATEQRYGVTIETRKARTPIPLACRRFGTPCFNKTMRGKLAILQNNGFDFNSAGIGIEHLALYKWWTEERGGQYGLTAVFKQFLVKHPPNFKISDRCCDHAKKHPASDFYKDFRPDLDLQGVRKSEGGPRSSTGGRFSGA